MLQRYDFCCISGFAFSTRWKEHRQVPNTLDQRKIFCLERALDQSVYSVAKGLEKDNGLSTDDQESGFLKAWVWRHS